MLIPVEPAVGATPVRHQRGSYPERLARAAPEGEEDSLTGALSRRRVPAPRAPCPQIRNRRTESRSSQPRPPSSRGRSRRSPSSISSWLSGRTPSQAGNTSPRWRRGRGGGGEGRRRRRETRARNCRFVRSPAPDPREGGSELCADQQESKAKGERGLFANFAPSREGRAGVSRAGRGRAYPWA